MLYARMPREIWGWHCTTVVAGLTLLAVATAALVKPGPTTLPEAAGIAALVGYPLVLASAAFVYAHWRLADSETSAWLATAFTALGVNGLAVGGAVTARPDLLVRGAAWLVLIELVVSAGVLVLVSMARYGEPTVDPMGLGLTIGVCLGLVFGAAVTRLEAPALPATLLLALAVPSLLVDVALARHLTTQTSLPAWCGPRVALGVALLGVGHVGGTLHPWTDASSVLRLGGTLLGAVVLVGAFMTLLRHGIVEATQALGAAGGRAAFAEALHDTERARIHEIGSTFAGIVSATRLISADQMEMPEQRRTSLERMLREEMGRLERMLAGQQAQAVDFDLDTVLQQLALSHVARGHRVDWTPSGLRAAGDPDQVAEVVNILLDNAAKHGKGLVRLAAVGGDGVVEISVSDEGTALCGTMSDGRLFEWGERGVHSTGQGIGLAIARSLAESQGGYLMLDGTAGTRTTFVVGLLVGESNDAVVGYRAS